MGSDPRTGSFVPPAPPRDSGTLVLFAVLAAMCALPTLIITEVMLISELRMGWLCTNPPASDGLPLAPAGSLESSLLPPQAMCTYSAIQDPSITVTVNAFAAGTVACWVSLAVLAACVVVGVRWNRQN